MRQPSCHVFVRAAVLAVCLASMSAAGGCMVINGSWSDLSWDGDGVALGSLSSRDLDLPSRQLTREFPVEAGQRLRLGNLAGEVSLKTGGTDAVIVEAVIHAQAESGEATRRLLEEVRWQVHTDADGRRTHWLMPPSSGNLFLHYPAIRDGQLRARVAGRTMTVTGSSSASAPTLFANLTITCPPTASELHADVGWGGIEIAAFTGDLRVDTGRGDVRLGPIDGELTADTSSGDIAVEALRGEGRLDTGSGEIEIRRVDSGPLAADTGSGDIMIRGGDLSAVRVDTGSGDIVLRHVEFESFDGDTGSGDIRIISSLARARRIVADTGSGDIRIVAGPDASFDLVVDVASGDGQVGYADAALRWDDRKIASARRGDGRTRIILDTGSGDCELMMGE
jgi:hypothetical protein